jgi:4-hydroxybenzoate polyprenyltransferase
MLTAMVLAYDAIHKKTNLAPLLMAACRFLLYLAAGSAAMFGIGSHVMWAGLALTAYIVGLSYLARRESTTNKSSRWPIALLFVPAVIALYWAEKTKSVVWIPLLVLSLWILWCVSGRPIRMRTPVPKGVGGLLAGIALSDWLATGSTDPLFGLVFMSLFLLAILLQRIAPAT